MQTDLFINGAYSSPAKGARFPVIEPATERELGSVALAGEEDEFCANSAGEKETINRRNALFSERTTNNLNPQCSVQCFRARLEVGRSRGPVGKRRLARPKKSNFPAGRCIRFGIGPWGVNE